MNAAHFIEETVRYLSLRLVLAPAAYVLPRRWALRVADGLALLLLSFPQTGTHLYWRMRTVFGTTHLDSFKLALGWLGRGYRDFIVTKRVLHGRENLFNWKIVERNTSGIDGLRESGESYIVATGHFRDASSYGMYAPAVTWGHVVRVASDPQSLSWSIPDLRIRYQFGTHLRATSASWRRRCELVLVGPDLPGAQTVYARLCERGNVVFIDVDAWWKRSRTGSYERPFAGRGSRVFATGAAELARLTHCPIISCVHWLESDGTVVLDWGTPIRVVGDGPGNDTEVTDALLDRLEIAVGDRPTQYILEIGGDRRWDSVSRRWKQ